MTGVIEPWKPLKVDIQSLETMKIQYPIIHSSVVYLSTFCLLLAVGCGGTEDGGTDCERLTADTSAIVSPVQLFTGTNGRDTYQAIIKTNFGDLSFASSNEQVATVESFGCLNQRVFGITGVVTGQAAGQTTITVSSGQFSRSVPITVTGYTTVEHDLGLQRYENPDNPSALRKGCADCHSQAGGAPHNPAALAGFSDQELIAATKLGKYPDKCILPTSLACNCTPVGTDPGTACDACSEANCSFTDGIVLDNDRTNSVEDPHVWDLTPEEEKGIMAYMRSIPPEGI